MSKLSQGELATTSLEFEYLHGKSQCEMLIGGDDISNDVITLGACFHMFFKVCYIPTRFRFMLPWVPESFLARFPVSVKSL